MQIKKQQLEPDMEKWTGSKLGKEYFKAVYCHSAYEGSSAGKGSTCNVGDLGSIPGLGISPGEGNSYPFQYSGLENSMDCIVHGVPKSWTQLSDFHFS